MEAWIAAVKKYGPLTGLVLLIPVLLPYWDKYQESQNNHHIALIVQKVKAEIVSDIASRIDAQTAEVRASHGRMNLTDKEALYLMKTAVGYQSIYKVDWMKKYLSPYSVADIQMAMGRVRTAIRAELIRQSNIYVEALNTFQHPKLGALGKFVADEFPMEEFLKGLYAIVESSPCLDCDVLYDNIMYYMLDAQNVLWQVAERKMK